ncbi:MAG: aspartate dehydrogenase [Oscillospiraceae bacterium]|jgi:hypothetical protein|nr:aspartate dehydrogenase [Oscillospiraceae bacterium]MDD3261827.1 aspartate dehydrogenase [Oscillospiraceae bacterium]
MFGRKKPKQPLPFDRTKQRPVIRASICTGERVAGFRNLQTGKFEGVLLLRSPADKERFLQMYGLAAEEVKTEY